jgi:hypothetical protein
MYKLMNAIPVCQIYGTAQWRVHFIERLVLIMLVRQYVLQAFSTFQLLEYQ